MENPTNLKEKLGKGWNYEEAWALLHLFIENTERYYCKCLSKKTSCGWALLEWVINENCLKRIQFNTVECDWIDAFKKWSVKKQSEVVISNGTEMPMKRQPK